MPEIKRQNILKILRDIMHPARGQDIISLGLVQGLVIKDDQVGFALNIKPDEAGIMEEIRLECDRRILTLEGVKSVKSLLTAERSPDRIAPPPQQPAKKTFGHGKPSTGPKPIAGIRHIIAVASGKGGVGKSTTAVNLALAFQTHGMKAGIFDIDIYGPSIPRMLGAHEKPTSTADDKIRPIKKHGLISMSIGYLMKKDTATIWRGPMVMGAIQQMISDVAWDDDGELDILVIDLPPGTGDAQLTMVQNVALDGSVIVSTPQDIALIDARKGLDMFRKTNTKVFGIIENMSYFLCPSCGDRSDIFGHGGARDTAQELGVDFLGEIPLHMDIRKTSDQGNPIVVSAPDSEHAKIYLDIAQKLMEKL